MIRRPPRSTHCISSAASDVYKRQVLREDSNGQVYVFVLIQPDEKDGYTTEKRSVKLGKSKNEIVEILKGITVGELIVDDGVNLLVDNQKVKRIIE